MCVQGEGGGGGGRGCWAGGVEAEGTREGVREKRTNHRESRAVHGVGRWKLRAGDVQLREKYKVSRRVREKERKKEEASSTGASGEDGKGGEEKR